MNFRFTIVETSLNRAEFRWKWLRFLELTLILGIVLCLAVLLLGVSVRLGWITSKSVASSAFVLLGVVGFITWAVWVISVVAGEPGRSWLAAALERVDPRLLDRLNTLVFLEQHPPGAKAESFARRIARQTQKVLAPSPSPSPFPATRTLRCLLAFIVALTATVLFYDVCSPWAALLAAQKAKLITPENPDKPLELAFPATNNVEQDRAWGEVRITDPGADLKVTKVDVVPLQIEAAANGALDRVNWFSTVNAAEEVTHELPPPAEPRYAAYQPTIYLDELKLSDWDVLTYYAKASTDKHDDYASEVYFLEVRPFREDILKLPGGENGQAHQCLNELSILIDRQQHVIRQTHQHLQSPPQPDNLRAQDRKKLSDAETDLGDSTRHLYAKMAAQMENKPIGEALDNLAKAEKSLDSAAKLLEDDIMKEARNRERGALSELVAARKAFQKAVTDNPHSFEEPKEDEPPPPVADARKKLGEMTEFRNESKAAQEFVQQTLEQQKRLDQQARSPSRTDYPRLGGQEKQLQQALQDFQDQHPRAFKGTEAESDEANQAMTKAADALQKRGNDARRATQQATEQLQKLSDAMKDQAAAQQLADAYRLKQMLDQQMRTFDERTRSNSSVSDATLQRTAKAARDTLNQLKKTAEQEPTRGAFGQPLRDALNNANKAKLDSSLIQLEYAEDEAAKQQRAGEARDGLGKVSQAFNESEPKSLQMAQQTDSLKPDEQESLNQGMAELESLIRQAENHRQIPAPDQAKQYQQALFNLQRGTRAQYGDNERTREILARLERLLKPDAGLDVGDLRRLMNELQHLAAETAEQLANEEAKPQLTHIDESHLPPAYRSRIQKYFQKLSEK